MIRSDNEQLAQVQGEHMLLIMHCWHYVRRSWYMKMLILLDPHSFLIQVTLLMMDIYRLLILMLLTDTDGGDHIWCMIVVDDYHGLV